MDYKINKEQYKVLKKFENKKEIAYSTFTKEELAICDNLVSRKLLEQAQKDWTTFTFYAYKINNNGIIAKEIFENDNENRKITRRADVKSTISLVVSILLGVASLVFSLVAILQ